MNLTGQPIREKAQKATPDPAYLSALHSLPCVICEAFGMVQLSPTQAHHVFHDRFSGRRTPDRMAIPLCEGHHQGLRDVSKVAIHRQPEAWRTAYGADHEYTAATQDAMEGMDL